MEPPTLLILASTSPRRRELLWQYGYEATVVAPAFEDPAAPDAALSPAQLAEMLSYLKARSVAEQLKQGVVLGGDTVVALGARLYGKPADRDDARATIRALAGTTHHVITGVTLLDARIGRRETGHDVTAVIMRPIGPDEVETYLDTGAWAGKAGAYGIQDHGDAFVERIEGSFTNVVGLPMELVTRMLAGWGITPTHRPSGATEPAGP